MNREDIDKNFIEILKETLNIEDDKIFNYSTNRYCVKYGQDLIFISDYSQRVAIKISSNNISRQLSFECTNKYNHNVKHAQLIKFILDK